MTFVKLGIPYRSVNSKGHECVITEIFNEGRGRFTIMNYNTYNYNNYNPCKALNSEVLKSIVKRSYREIWCGDFNAHNSILGSK